MKTFFVNSRRIVGLSITAALLALAAPATQAAVQQPPPPTGMWDCIMSGNGQSGIIFLNFMAASDTSNGLPTFEGIFVQAGHTKVQTGRAGAVITGRSGSSKAFTNLFGGGFINGSSSGGATNVGPDDWLVDSRSYRGNWFYNSKGQTVGSYYTVLDASSFATNFFQTCIDQPLQIPLTNGGFTTVLVDFCFTNPVFVTNFPWSATDGEFGSTNLVFTNNNFTVGSVGITNNVSFVGKVVLGKRLTLVGSSAFGKFTIRGVPLRPVTTQTPVDGFFWTGTKVQNGFRFVEEFHLSPSAILNAYGMTGAGPSYNYGTTNTLCLISNQKQIGFSVDEIPFGIQNPLIVNSRTTVGKLTNTRKAIGTKGVGCSTADPNLIKFNADLSPFSLP